MYTILLTAGYHFREELEEMENVENKATKETL